MKNTLDYAVLAAHGSAINALHGFMNMQDDSSCLYHANLENFDNYIYGGGGGAYSQGKGVIIDSVSFEENGLLTRILEAAPSLLIVLTRDPLARMKSVINTHIQWYANSASGFFERDVKDVLLFQHGDPGNFINFMLPSHNMNTAACLFSKIKGFFKKILFFDASEFAPENALKTLNLIRENLELPQLKNLAGPTSLVFTKENTFVRDIRRLKLTLEDNVFYLKPYPLEHLPILHIKAEDVIFACEPAAADFEVGRFTGEIGFVAIGEQPSTTQKTAIQDLLANYPHILNRYGKDMSNRYKLASKISAALLLTNERILDLCQENIATAKLIKEFIASQYAALFEHQNQPWLESKKFLAEMEAVME